MYFTTLRVLRQRMPGRPQLRALIQRQRESHTSAARSAACWNTKITKIYWLAISWCSTSVTEILKLTVSGLILMKLARITNIGKDGDNTRNSIPILCTMVHARNTLLIYIWPLVSHLCSTEGRTKSMLLVHPYWKIDAAVFPLSQLHKESISRRRQGCTR